MLLNLYHSLNICQGLCNWLSIRINCWKLVLYTYHCSRSDGHMRSRVTLSCRYHHPLYFYLIDDTLLDFSNLLNGTRIGPDMHPYIALGWYSRYSLRCFRVVQCLSQNWKFHLLPVGCRLKIKQLLCYDNDYDNDNTFIFGHSYP